jgi:exocyst complex component 4
LLVQKWFVREIWDLRSANVPLSLLNSKITTQINDNGENDSPETKSSKRWSNQEPRPAKESNNDDMGPVLLPLKGEIAK